MSDMEYMRRFSSRRDELEWLFMELYDDRAALERFEQEMRAAYDARSAELHDMDMRRAANTDWYKQADMLGMMMYTDQFAGTLNDLCEKLPYLREQGVRYLHLMPLLQMPHPHNDGGYAVEDFERVDPAIGSNEDLSRLTKLLRDAGISLCLDFVMNHTASSHEWAMRAKAGEKVYQDMYFCYEDRTIPDQFEQTMPEVFPSTSPGNFSWIAEMGQWVLTTFHTYQWDLNYRNPEVFVRMVRSMLLLANLGVEVLRIDAVPYIWKELGTSCRNLRQVHTLVRLVRLACECVCPGVLLLGEVVMEPSKVIPYFGTVSQPECHMLYNVTTMASTWHTVATQDVRLLRSQLDQVFALPAQYTFLNYLRCHDDIGWGLDYDYLAQFSQSEVAHKRYLNDYLIGKWPGSSARGELYNDDPRLGDARLCGTTASLCGAEENKEQALAKIEMLHAFLLTLSGVPVLYSGDEIGQLNDYSYHDDPFKSDDSRYLHRGAFSWEDAEKRNDAESWQGSIFLRIHALRKARAAYGAFNTQANTWTLDTGSDHVLGIGRYHEGKSLLAFFNFGDQTDTLYIDGAFTDLLHPFCRVNGQVSLPPYSFLWLSKEA